MIRILSVEDDDRMCDQMAEWVRSVSPSCELRFAGDRDTALEAIGEMEIDYDLVICDLRIPPTAGSIDSKEQYGLEVHEVCRISLPGVPCVFLTGHATDADVYDQIARGPNEDLYGNRSVTPLVELFHKLDSAPMRSYLERMEAELRELEGIEVSTGGLELTPHELRVAQIFGRRYGGRTVQLTPLGGLSGAKTFRARVFNDAGARQATVFGKVTTISAALQEEANLARYAAAHLDPACIPTVSDRVRAGAGRYGGVFFSMAERFDRSLFHVLEQDAGTASSALRSLEELTEPWLDAGKGEAFRVRSLRQLRVPDRIMSQYEGELSALDVELLEDRPVEFRVAPQHGDLHGHNLLVDSAGRLMLIDFGETGEHPAGIDGVILETSLAFHSDRPAPAATWPSPEQAALWADIEEYAAAAPYPEFVRECRNWATNCAGGPSTVAVLTYIDALRQLKYADTSKDVAAALAVAAGQAALALLGTS